MTTNKSEATKGFINLWLHDQTIYCNQCGMPYHPEMVRKNEPCCDNPQMGRNFDHMYGLIQQNRRLRDLQKNEYGSNKEMTMRACVSLPPKLLKDLEEFYKGYGEKLFNDDKELQTFMKDFPEFRIPAKI